MESGNLDVSTGNDETPAIGTLSSTPLPELFRSLYRDRASGNLDLQLEDEQRRVAFVSGEVKSATSNQVAQMIGPHLKAAGLVADSDISNALRTRKGERIGRALVSVGALDEETLDLELRKLVASIVYDAFSWADGKFRFTPSANPVDADIMLTISTADVIMEGIRRIESDDAVSAGIGNPSRPLRFTSDPFLRLQHLTLTPEEGFLISRIDGRTTIDQLVKETPVPAAKTKRFVYGLLATGILLPNAPAGEEGTGSRASFDSTGTGKRRDAGPAAPTKPITPVGLNVRIAVERRSAAMITVPKPAAPDVRKEEIDYRRRKIQTTHARLASLSAYDLLEVAKNPTYREVRQKFNDLAEIYHPDVSFQPDYADLKPALTAIFRKLEESYRAIAHRIGAQIEGDDEDD